MSFKMGPIPINEVEGRLQCTPGGVLNVWVGRCGWGAQILTLFKTEMSDFHTLFKTTCSSLRPGLNTSNQKSLSSFVVAQASGISANKKVTNSAFGTIFTNLLCVRASRLNIRIPCLRQKVMKSIPRLRKDYPENTISYAASPC